MSGDLSRRISPTARQSEVEGWMVLVAPSTHDSNESNSSSEEPTAAKKRKFRKSSQSPRSAKSPRVSASDISAKSTRPLVTRSPNRHSLGMMNASRSTSMRTEASGNAIGDTSISDGKASGSTGPSGVTRVNDRPSGASAVSRQIQRSSISTSEMKANGDRLKMDEQKADVIIISSDSEVELQLTDKKSKPRQLQPSTLDKFEKAKGQKTKAFLSDSEGAIDLTSDQEITTVPWAEQGKEEQISLSGPTLRSSVTSHAHSPAHPHPRTGGSHDASQTTKRDRDGSTDLGAKRTIGRPAFNLSSPANARRSLDHRLSSEISKGSSTHTSAQTEPSLADVISMSLGGTPSSASRVDKSFLPRPTRHMPIPRPSLSKQLHSSQKPVPPPPDTEIIDLCSDSDHAMELDNLPSSELGPSHYVHSAAVSGSETQLRVAQNDEASAHLSCDFSPLRVDSPPTVPTSSSFPDPTPVPRALTPPSNAYLEALDVGDDLPDGLTDILDELETHLEVTSPRRSDAASDAPGLPNVHRALSRSNSSNPSVRGVASGSSDKGSYRTRSPSASVGSLHPSSLRNSVEVEGSLAQDLVAPVSEMHLHTHIDDTLQETWDTSPVEEDLTSPETISDDVAPINYDTQSSISERVSPATSSGAAMSTSTRSQISAPSVQRARKTTQVAKRQVTLNKEKAICGSRASQTMDVETQHAAAAVTPSSKRILAAKEPDFTKLRDEIPDIFSSDGRLSAAIKWPAEKVPIELHDMINCLPLNYHYNPQMKYVFEAMMEENTADDEPTSPRIEIYGGKSGPVTPPWEFFYTNKIFHGEGVARSNKKKLKGCDCIGPCNPKSKTCACVRKQMTWTGDDKSIKGFLYNKKGKLVDLTYPVFECNDACECSDDCMNRVIQHGRRHAISIMHTKNKGWGVFADEKIPRGTYLGIYAGEMVLESEADERGKLYDKFGRTYLFDVDFWHLRKLDEDAQKRTGDDPSSQASMSRGVEERFSSTYTIDAFHVGNFTRFLNHSCDPNCQITASYVNEPDLRKPMLTIYTSRDVHQGEELTFAYFGPRDDEEDENEEETELDEHGQKKVKVVGGPSSHKNEAVHRPCLCGAANCRGEMF